MLSPATLVADDYAKARSLLLDAKNRVDRLSDYTLNLTSQERVGGTLLPEATMFVKFKRPFSVYIKTLTGKQKDREIIYVKGKNNDKMIVSNVSIFGGLTARIPPDSIWAKKESRHTISEAGLPNTMGRMVSILEKEDKAAACRPTVTYLGEGYRSSKKVISVRIENSSYAPKTEITLDVATLFPVSITSYDADGSLLESYNYRDIKTNVGLTDADFDPASPAYHF
ncbi:MAG: DUF1571 domain-containing protein [Deltaproteobacteria bacterium]|nr:DUF1571 domain-containing protein [Candidatus Zymogenaceae bacterium]